VQLDPIRNQKPTISHQCRSPDSLVGVVTGYGLDGPGFDSQCGKIFFSSPQRPDRLWGPPSPLSSGNGGGGGIIPPG
jgi:hypothetical protein